MEISDVIKEFGRNTQVYMNLFGACSSEEFNWRPAPGKWNLLEVVCHLRDEELEDFRARTKSVLEDPKKALTPIDPQAWVKERKYADKDFYEVLNAFLQERHLSIEWLRSLEDPDWTNTYQHEQLGALSAMLFLENWVAHDLLHIRQIINIKFAYLKHIASEPLDYAGGV